MPLQPIGIDVVQVFVTFSRQMIVGETETI